MAKLNKDEVISGLKEMSMVEIMDLVKAIETEFGVKAAAAAAAPAAGAAGAAAAAPSEVSVILKSFGTAKIAVIKAVQVITGTGLMDAKKLVDKAPVAIKEKISAAEANQIKDQLVKAGAEVEVK
ncbi:MAG: 50S ribosomal protein L7/L12 [Bacilli bacterium]|jgi:large subunit ribosomal protein L7/L12|nr:50S ribosomal protein L7/L12 [Bacilli bacterium]